MGSSLCYCPGHSNSPLNVQVSSEQLFAEDGQCRRDVCAEECENQSNLAEVRQMFADLRRQAGSQDMKIEEMLDVISTLRGELQQQRAETLQLSAQLQRSDLNSSGFENVSRVNYEAPSRSQSSSRAPSAHTSMLRSVRDHSAWKEPCLSSPCAHYRILTPPGVETVGPVSFMFNQTSNTSFFFEGGHCRAHEVAEERSHRSTSVDSERESSALPQGHGMRSAGLQHILPQVDRASSGSSFMFDSLSVSTRALSTHEHCTKEDRHAVSVKSQSAFARRDELGVSALRPRRGSRSASP